MTIYRCRYRSFETEFTSLPHSQITDLLNQLKQLTMRYDDDYQIFNFTSTYIVH